MEMKKSPVPDAGAGSLPLSEWLEKQGSPLNTRCGGRGLCRGCIVHLETSSGTTEVRACQTPCDSLPEEITAVLIPPSSLHDNSLHGVTAFELRGGEAEFDRQEGIGLALDIGTTTIAGALWDFSTGRCLADAAVANAQRRHGDNVIARVSFGMEHPDGVALLRDALVHESVNPLVRGLCETAGIDPSQITRANAAGNPSMLHTLAGESLEGFATFPFRPVFLGERTMGAGAGGLLLECPLTLLPGLGPFVGSDITAGALASGISEDEPPVLLIDFGTNGEILLKHEGGCLATATAAGPAFEGGRLACGAPAGPGVISSLRMENGRWAWKMVSGNAAAPRALSGAAYIDFIATAAREGIMGPTGRLDRGHPMVARVENAPPGAAFRVAISRQLFVSEADIAEILQAKAAIAAGVATLLELAKITTADLNAVYVAGGFGYHLSPQSARGIGLLPSVPPDRVFLIGNSSLGGASLLLRSAGGPKIAELVAQTKVIELNLIESFQDHFTDALALPEA